MSRRIRQLEDALSLLQPSHPLLREEYLRIKFPPISPEDTTIEKEDIPAEAADLADAYGTLTLEAGGRTRYLGRTGGSESLLGVSASPSSTLPNVDQRGNPQGEDQHSAESESAYSSVPSDISQLSRFFPFMNGPQNLPPSLSDIINYLPENARARSLCEVFLTQTSWSPRLVMRDELIDDILTPVYTYIESKLNHRAPVKDEAIPVSPHRLAVLFLVFALGTLVDPTLEPYHVHAKCFFDLGKACLSLNSVLESSELATLQAVTLTGYFFNHGGPWYSTEAPWSLLGLCTSMVYRLGLHWESPKWNLEPKTINRRRALFWDVHFIDTFYSLSLGRPSALHVSFINCPFPDDPEDPIETEVMKLLRWGWKFCKEVVSQVTIATLKPHIPDYATILDLDKRIREHGVPPDDVKADPPSLHTRGLIVTPTASIHLHRSFFLRAIKDHPDDPMGSPYALSFLAAYRGASTVIQLDAKACSQDPSWLTRRWGVFNSLLSAGIIVGLIVSRCPTHNTAQKAFDDLTLLVDMFSRISNSSGRARAAHGALKKMHDKAIRILNETNGQGGHNEIHDGGVTSDDDLEIFAGRAKARVSNNKEGNDRREDSSTTSVPPQRAIQYGGDPGPTSGQTPGFAFSPSPYAEGLPSAPVGDLFALPSFPTIGRESGPDFHLQERQGHRQVLQIHDMYGQLETEHQPRHQSDLEDTFYVDWKRQPPPHEIVHPPTAGLMGGGMNAQWLALMQEEGFIDPHPGNLNAQLPYPSS
ncbi:hypothetical protein PQX77_000584 [Marasmius sp. AFHP31]|nr:hypothetical protein PQX77_000584 [Marasmius sp. AFHP31]